MSWTNVSVNIGSDYKVKVHKHATDGSSVQGFVPGVIVGGEFVPASASDPIPIAGTFSASLATASTSTGTVVSASNVSSVALAANGVRKGGWLKNIGSVTCFVSFSGTAATNKPTQLEPGDSIPLVQYGAVIYTGAVSAITAASTTNLEVVELA